jgi:hypothetical protein
VAGARRAAADAAARGGIRAAQRAACPPSRRAHVAAHARRIPHRAARAARLVAGRRTGAQGGGRRRAPPTTPVVPVGRRRPPAGRGPRHPARGPRGRLRRRPWWGFGVWRVPDSPGGPPPRLVGSAGRVPRAAEPRAAERARAELLAHTRRHGPGVRDRGRGRARPRGPRRAGVLRLEIRIDPANEPSCPRPAPTRLPPARARGGDRTDRDGRPLDTLVWEAAARPPRACALPPLATCRGCARSAGPVRREPAAAPRRGGPRPITTPPSTAALLGVGRRRPGARLRLGHPAGRRGGVGRVRRPRRRGARRRERAPRPDHRRALDARPPSAHAGTEPGSRAERMYRAAGWLPIGRAANGDVRFVREL